MKKTKLSQARAAAGLTQARLAEIAGVSVLCYQQYESGKRIPRADTAIRIARAVGSSVEELFGAELSSGI